MNPTTITARVNDQRLRLVNEALIASGGVDVLQIRFEFCDLWEGCGRTAVFYRDPETVYHVPVIDDLVTVPSEMLADEGHFYFGVFGVKSNLRPTEVVKVNVVRGAITAATATPEDPAPDIYEQILAAYGHLEQRVNDVDIYVGAGEMPEEYRIQIDPDGAVFVLDTELNAASPNPVANSAITQRIEGMASGIGVLTNSVTSLGGRTTVVEEGLAALESQGKNALVPGHTIVDPLELENLTTEGRYYIDFHERPYGYPIHGRDVLFGVVEVTKVDSGRKYMQKLYAKEFSACRVFVRMWDDVNEWYDDWCCENPDLFFLNEVRTTRTDGNKPIYAKRVFLGKLENNGTKRVAHGIENLSKVVDIVGRIYLINDNETYLPAYRVDRLFAEGGNVFVDGTDVAVKTTTDWLAYTCEIDLYYTKNV